MPTSYADFIGSQYFDGLSEYSELNKYLSNRLNIVKWIDLELALVDYVNESKHPNLNADFGALAYALERYLSELDLSNLPKASPAYKFIEVLVNDGVSYIDNYDTTILNFNYTGTVEKVKEECRRGRSLNMSIKYVHGKLSNRIVLGYNGYASIPVEASVIRKTANHMFTSYDEYLHGCDELIIFGHSLGESDEAVFKPFFEAQISKTAKRKRIVIYGYKLEGIEQLKQRIEKMSNGKISLLETKNDVKFIDIAPESSVGNNSIFSFETMVPSLFNVAAGVGISFAYWLLNKNRNE